ncbi:MAG: hypothetical protein WA175_01895 [Candidatus Acidiferrales bacterium]
MDCSSVRGLRKWMSVFCFALFALLFSPTLNSQGRGATSKPLILSSQLEKGTLIYRLNGRRVEDSKENSLLANLEDIVKTRGTNIPVFVIIDARAPFTEIGKLGTALDKVELTHDRRLFVSYFSDGMMNEIHWDDNSIPIPRN